jgi:adenylate kinase
MNIVLLGPPGVGKGTNAKYLSERLKLTHISTGDMFRQAIKDQTVLGTQAKSFLDRGALVPDELTTQMVQERLAKPDAKRGFLLDGYPRTLEQAKALDQFTTITAVVLLEASKRIILERIKGRLANDSSRTDDDPDIVKQRIAVYELQTTPLADYYRNEGLLYEIDVSYPLEEWEAIAKQYDEMLKDLGGTDGRENS